MGIYKRIILYYQQFNNVTTRPLTVGHIDTNHFLRCLKQFISFGKHLTRALLIINIQMSAKMNIAMDFKLCPLNRSQDANICNQLLSTFVTTGLGFFYLFSFVGDYGSESFWLLN